ncbi:2-oxoglutarate-dependent dioxygenase htyE-like [Cyprinus carpio]|uniref:2-oxoglutarate-dependent dioxygenase htyE-like n=1 Tax=Cyprinus carpio TaxID=7962 RepID=A0A9Q9XDJ5_CYPCA|nr:2-oxoglutarate-dependent dioxygenase htyE-like [Cyprinus carpio]
MALGLNLEAEVFLSAHKHIGSDGNGTTLRTLYYPPVNSTCVKENQLRCGEHSDYGSITLVFQSSEGGLQVLNRAGEFISAPSIPGTVLINIADLMQRWTSDIYVSAVHRVLLPPAGDSSTRQSLAFFVQPDDEAMISCCDGSDKYPPVKSVDYLLSRFKESYGKN